MKRFICFAMILAIAAAFMFAPSDASRRMPTPGISVDLSAVTYATYTEILRIPTMPAGYNEQADVIFLRIVATSLAGGTESLIRVVPCWTDVSTPTTGDPMPVAYADVLDSTVVELAASREVIVAPKWTATTVFMSNTFSVLPPYISVQLQEDRTSGTIAIDVQMLVNR